MSQLMVITYAYLRIEDRKRAATDSARQVITYAYLRIEEPYPDTDVPNDYSYNLRISAD